MNKTTLSLLLFASSVLTAGDIVWKNSSTGSSFLLVPGNRSWSQSKQYCAERHMTLFNYHYLSSDDRTAFLNSELIDSLRWNTVAENYPAERKLTKIWMSSEKWDNASALQLTQYPDESNFRIQTMWENKAKTDTQTLCMFSARTWFGCQHYYECRKIDSSGAAHLRIFKIYEYGESKSQAMERLRERLDKHKSSSGTCEFIEQSPTCIQYW